MSRESSVVREPLRPDLPPVWLASPPGSAATFVRSEESLDQPENVVPPRSRSMVLRSHSRAGRSKLTGLVLDVVENRLSALVDRTGIGVNISVKSQEKVEVK